MIFFNSIQVHELCDGQVVRFRCMIQDMFDPEFYVKTFRYKYVVGIEPAFNGQPRQNRCFY